MLLVPRVFASTPPEICRVGILSVTKSEKLVSARLKPVVCEFAILPDMFCRAYDWACNPLTAVVKASKIPIPILHSCRDGRCVPQDGQPPTRTRRRKPRAIKIQWRFQLFKRKRDNHLPLGRGALCLHPTGNAASCRAPGAYVGVSARQVKAPLLLQ